MKYKERQFAVIFLHSESWTISAVEGNKEVALMEMEKQKELCPSFKYRVVPCVVNFESKL